MGEKLEILNRYGLIEAEPRMQRRYGLLRGLIAKDEHRRIARQYPDNHEDDGQHAEQRDETEAETAHEKGGQDPRSGAAAPLPVPTVGFGFMA